MRSEEMGKTTQCRSRGMREELLKSWFIKALTLTDRPDFLTRLRSLRTIEEQ